MSLAEIQARLSAYVPKLLGILPGVILIIVGCFLLNLIIGRALLLLARRTHLSESDVMPVKQILRWLVRVAGCVLILNVFGFELGGVWAVASTILGLVAIGFVAVWSLISHTTATFLLLFLRPFQVGDDIEFPGEQVRGRVIDLNLFFTTLIDHRGRLQQVPNNLFFQKTLTRVRNASSITLAFQLNNPLPADVSLPPPPDDEGTSKKPKDPDPLLMMPDPRSITPPARG